MTLMWVALAVMAIFGVLIVVHPLLTFRPKQELSGDVINAMLFKDRLKELDQDVIDGRIVQSEYDQLKQELELTLLSDVNASTEKAKRGLGGGWLAIPLVLLVPAAAFLVYWTEGYHPELVDWYRTQERMQQVMPQMMAGNFEVVEKENIGVDDFIRALQRQLQGNPEDAQSWYLLGVSYLQVQMPKQSELAFSRALNLNPNNVDYVMGYTQATLAVNGGNMTPQIRATLEQVMRAQPDNPKPYMTMGMAFFQGGDYQGAIQIWERYMSRENADPRAVQLLQRSIEVAQNEMANGVSGQGQEPAQSGATGPQLAVTVTVSDEVMASVKPTDILFIYAKAASGPPLPLAVVRQPVSSWPVSVTLSDANAMTPAMTLSKFKDVVVQARISSSGNAIPQSGDWSAEPLPIKVSPQGQAVELTIASRLP